MTKLVLYDIWDPNRVTKLINIIHHLYIHVPVYTCVDTVRWVAFLPFIPTATHLLQVSLSHFPGLLTIRATCSSICGFN